MGRQYKYKCAKDISEHFLDTKIIYEAKLPKELKDVDEKDIRYRILDNFYRTDYLECKYLDIDHDALKFIVKDGIFTIEFKPYLEDDWGCVDEDECFCEDNTSKKYEKFIKNPISDFPKIMEIDYWDDDITELDLTFNMKKMPSKKIPSKKISKA